MQSLKFNSVRFRVKTLYSIIGILISSTGYSILSKSNSCSYLKLEGSDFISENLTKLLNDNEENKVKIEYLNDKIKTMKEIEKKCDELIERNSYSNCTYKIRNLGSSKERRYE